MIQNQHNSISSYASYFSFKSETQNYINEKLILPTLEKFFIARKINNYQSINQNGFISDLDFKIQDFDYFYKHIFNDIKKSSNDIFDLTTKYIVTFDKANCSLICDDTQLFYDQINIFNKPILYFIYFDPHEIIKFSRSFKKT